MRGDYGVGLISAGADILSPIEGTIPAASGGAAAMVSRMGVVPPPYTIKHIE
ncbi:MAG: hypothetical protein LV473_10715 [Nitrospira sp.]|nr:hypothetical protein [Nitrospira sp.]